MNVSLVVFDMAGTTVRDREEVQSCFLQAAERTGLETSAQEVLPMMGFSKRLVFERLWTRHLGSDPKELQSRVEASYQEFRTVLESHYRTAEVVPTEGCLDCFESLRSEGIPIALTTGFYRTVTDIILGRLGWDQGLDDRRVGTAETVIQASVCSDEVPLGRPAPDMIRKVMDLLGVSDVTGVVKIGDTPVDLEAGKNARCGLTLAITNGTHTADQLSPCANDGLLESLKELADRLRQA